MDTSNQKEDELDDKTVSTLPAKDDEFTTYFTDNRISIPESDKVKYSCRY